jgi:hypothetical protein
MAHRPSWFKDDFVLVSNAPTCGINKDGLEQYVVDRVTGVRSETDIDDQLARDVAAIRAGDFSSGCLSYAELSSIGASRIAVPGYFDRSTVDAFDKFVSTLNGFESQSIGDLADAGLITLTNGHGSPSADQRLGDVPYIKVSDLRAGHVNINPTNMIPEDLAKKFWKGAESKLKAYDLISPERASKNIGEFCVLMPGQERVVLTKEVIIIRATEVANFDQFYLLWALTLTYVRDHWKRVILMQTNREDVGDRALEIRLPVPKMQPGADAAKKMRAAADAVSQHFRTYFIALDGARAELAAALARSPYKHHVFWT